MSNEFVINVERTSSSAVDAELLLAMRGEKGDKGDTGARGLQGERGAQGEKGDTGNGISAIWFDESNCLHILLDNGDGAISEPVTESVEIDTFLVHFNKSASLEASENEVALDMLGYEYDPTDILFVYINGMIAIPDVDYTVTVEDNVATVTLNSSESARTVYVKAIKSRIGYRLLLTSSGDILTTNDGYSLSI